MLHRVPFLHHEQEQMEVGYQLNAGWMDLDGRSSTARSLFINVTASCCTHDSVLNCRCAYGSRRSETVRPTVCDFLSMLRITAIRGRPVQMEGSAKMVGESPTFR